MKFDKKLIYVINIAIIIVLLIGGYFAFFYSPWKFTEDRPIKIFMLNSYSEELPPGDVLISYVAGFNDGLRALGIEYKIERFDLDTIDANFSEQEEIGLTMEAKRRIDEYQPDLLFTTDDYVQEHIVQKYYLNTDLPIVFAGLNKDPSVFDYDKSANVAGIVDKEHLVDSIDFLKDLFPGVEKIAFIVESDPFWERTIEDWEKQVKEAKGIEVVGWNYVSTFDEFKERVLYYQDKADALVTTTLITLVDEEGSPVVNEEIIRWLVENSNIPEISTRPTPSEGILSSVSFSTYEEGRAAADLVYEIMINGKSPSSLGFEPAKRGSKYINLARAESLGLKKENIPSAVLINSKIIEKFPWDTEK